MKRKILFRAKVKHHDQMTNPEDGWVWGYYRQDIKGGELKHYIFNCPMEWEIIPETLGQYTDVYDGEENRIFEGDIIRYNESDLFGGYITRVGYVKYEKGSYYVYLNDVECEYLSWVQCQDEFLEVIGNIHDNEFENLKSLQN